MFHIRTDQNMLNRDAQFACGIAWPLPDGDKYFFDSEAERCDRRVDCPICREKVGLPPEQRRLGTPLSQISGRPGHPGFEEFKRIAASWGYD